MKQRHTEISKTLRPSQAWVELRRGRNGNEQTNARRTEPLTRRPKIRAKTRTWLNNKALGISRQKRERLTVWEVLNVNRRKMIGPACVGLEFWRSGAGEMIGPACVGLEFWISVEGEMIGPTCVGPIVAFFMMGPKVSYLVRT